jgi:RimJ/RimL family protein N-acetyltransferase
VEIDHRFVFLESDHVFLKVLTRQDIEESNWFGWFNDAERCEMNQHHYFGNSPANQETILQEIASKEKIQFGIIDKSEQKAICGVVSLQDLNYINGTGHLAIMIDKAKESNPRIFADAMRLMLQHGFNELRLNKIVANSMNKQLPVVLKTLFNFELEGVLKDHVYKSGEFRDVYLTSVWQNSVRYRG